MDEELFGTKAVKTFSNAYNNFDDVEDEVKDDDFQNDHQQTDFVPLTTLNAVKYLLEGSLKYKVCRYCLHVVSPLSDLDEIFEVARKGFIHKVTIRDMIASVHPFQVGEDPNFPDKICSRCIESALSSYLFSQQCERAARALRNCFNDLYTKFEKLDPLDMPKKRGRQKLNPNPNKLYTDFMEVLDYAEPIIHLINTGSENLIDEDETKISDLECPKCWQMLPDYVSFVNHGNLHPKDMWYSCRLCGTSFITHRRYKKHIRDIHKPGYVQPKTAPSTCCRCNECGFVSTTFGKHLQHMEKHKFKTTFDHLVNRNMKGLCAVCLEKSSCMIHMNETVELYGGYPGLNNEQAIYNIVTTSFPEMSTHNYTGTHICEKCLDSALTSHVFVNKIRHVRSRLYNCVSALLEQLNEISSFDKNLMIEISEDSILPLIKEEPVFEDDDGSSVDESKLKVDVLEDEFRTNSEEESDHDVDSAKSDIESIKSGFESSKSVNKSSVIDDDEETETLANDFNEIQDFIENPAKKVTKTYVNKKLLNGYQSLIVEDDSLNNVCEFLTFKKKQKVVRRSYKCKFTCPYCSKHFISDYFLKKHILKHTVSKVYCKLCKMLFKSKFYLFEHVKMIHIMNESCYNSCKVCGRTFNNTKKMKMHEKCHKTKHCPLCDKYYSTQKYFDVHMQRHMIKLNMTKSRRVQTCSFCEKECANENELSLHVNKAHLQIKPYSCDMCDRLFYTEYDLRNHKKVHNLLLEETCEFCKKTFKCRKNLVIHVRKHLGTKPHVCQVCRQAFYSENRMNRHMVIYHGGRFCCRLCKTVLSTKSDLRTHISIEHCAM